MNRLPPQPGGHQGGRGLDRLSGAETQGLSQKQGLGQSRESRREQRRPAGGDPSDQMMVASEKVRVVGGQAHPAVPVPADALAALRRLRTSRPKAEHSEAPAVVERCELCAVPVPAEHRHVVNVDGQAGPAAPVPADARAALRRILTSRPKAHAETPTVVERCELCAVPVSAGHRHVVNLDSRALLCACRPCSLLFEHPEAELAYRTVPDRHLALPPMPRQQWESLEVPVGLAFVFRNSRQDRTVLCYPGPAGATEADLPTDACQAFAEAVPDVEAVLIRAREDGAAGLADNSVDRFVVPIDVCYALVGHLRTLWRGFDGGSEAHARIAEFFADIERKAVRSA